MVDGHFANTCQQLQPTHAYKQLAYASRTIGQNVSWCLILPVVTFDSIIRPGAHSLVAVAVLYTVLLFSSREPSFLCSLVATGDA